MTNRRPGAQSTALLAGLAVVIVGALGVIALFALNLGPFGPGATPSPLASGRATLPAPTTGAPTSSPGSSPGATNLPGASGSARPSSAATPAGSLTPEDALLGHIPEQVRSTCTIGNGRGNLLMIASCTAADGTIAVTYYQYESAESMTADYEDIFGASQIEPDSGNCADQATWPAEGSYQVGGADVGRRLCTEQPGQPAIYWTDDRLNILGEAVGQAPEYERLVDFWSDESGPIP